MRTITQSALIITSFDSNNPQTVRQRPLAFISNRSEDNSSMNTAQEKKISLRQCYCLHQHSIPLYDLYMALPEVMLVTPTCFSGANHNFSP